MDATGIFSSILGGIPKVIGGFRDLATKLLASAGLPSSSTTALFAILAAVGSYYYLKQWITSSLWLKISTILNFILLALLIFLVLTRVG